jgi:hypothetical protein
VSWPGLSWLVPAIHAISASASRVVAAYGDGTIRWHRMDDGRELLALYVLGDKKNWVVRTPEGFYAATPGAYGVLRWHVNRGVDAAAETVPDLRDQEAEPSGCSPVGPSGDGDRAGLGHRRFGVRPPRCPGGDRGH